MRKIDFDAVFKSLKELTKSEDYSDSSFGKKELEFPPIKDIDFSEAKGDELILILPFANRVDLSGSKLKKLRIVGKVNILDLTGAKIDIFDKSQLKAVIVDRFKARIKEEI